MFFNSFSIDLVKLEKWRRWSVYIQLKAQGYCKGCNGRNGTNDYCNKCDAFNKEMSKISTGFYSLLPPLCYGNTKFISGNHPFGNKQIKHRIEFRRRRFSVKNFTTDAIGIFKRFQHIITNRISKIKVPINDFANKIFHRTV